MRVPYRTKKTLNAVRARCIEAGSVVYTDCWGDYNDLKEIGYVHQTVNDSRHYVDPETGVHTQEIENV